MKSIKSILFPALLLLMIGCGSTKNNNSSQTQNQDTTLYKKIMPNTVSFNVVDFWDTEEIGDGCCMGFQEGDVLFTRNFTPENSEITLYIPSKNMNHWINYNLGYVRFKINEKKDSPDREVMEIYYNLIPSVYHGDDDFSYDAAFIEGSNNHIYSCRGVECRDGTEFIITKSCIGKEDIKIDGLNIGYNYYPKYYSIDCSDGGLRTLVFFSYRKIPLEVAAPYHYGWLKDGLIVISNPPIICSSDGKVESCQLSSDYGDGSQDVVITLGSNKKQ